jgi:hypothetical protein
MDLLLDLLLDLDLDLLLLRTVWGDFDLLNLLGTLLGSSGLNVIRGGMKTGCGRFRVFMIH